MWILAPKQPQQQFVDVEPAEQRRRAERRQPTDPFDLVQGAQFTAAAEVILGASLRLVMVMATALAGLISAPSEALTVKS
jgi:hypothetical protein